MKVSSKISNLDEPKNIFVIYFSEKILKKTSILRDQFNALRCPTFVLDGKLNQKSNGVDYYKND